MRIQVRARDKDPLAVFLGWFSIGLGSAQIAAPRMLCKLIGANDDGISPNAMRAMGAREIAQGTGILVRPRPTMWLWSRVAGTASTWRARPDRVQEPARANGVRDRERGRRDGAGHLRKPVPDPQKSAGPLGEADP
jgi:hypothetical protein